MTRQNQRDLLRAIHDRFGEHEWKYRDVMQIIKTPAYINAFLIAGWIERVTAAQYHRSGYVPASYRIGKNVADDIAKGKRFR